MKQLYFPVCDSKEQYLKRKSSGDQFFYNISPEMRKVIDEIAPYRGGNDALWRLSIYNNIDKHKMLVASAGMGASVNMGLGKMMADSILVDSSIPEERRKAQAEASLLFDKEQPLFWRLKDPLFPIKVGDAFLHGVEQNENVQLRSHFALGVPGLIPPQEFNLAIAEIAMAVENVATKLEPFFKE